MIKMGEECESKIACLLASMNNLAKNDYDSKITVLCKIIVLQEKMIQDLQEQLDGHEEDYEHKEKPFWEKEAKL